MKPSNPDGKIAVPDLPKKTSPVTVAAAWVVVLVPLGWGVYQTDHEDANYQYEINFRYSDALTTADRLTFFRMMAAQVARPFGAIATFMPKPFADRTGSGAHLHFHPADAESGRHLFRADADDHVSGTYRPGG